jgi:hypothetical protein
MGRTRRAPGGLTRCLPPDAAVSAKLKCGGARPCPDSAGQIQLRNHIRDSQDEYGRTLSASTG